MANGFSSDRAGKYVMRIHCENWNEGLKYFLDERTVKEMNKVGLKVVRMDWRNKDVILNGNDDDYGRALEGIKAVEMTEAETNDKPDDLAAVKVITSAPVL